MYLYQNCHSYELKSERLSNILCDSKLSGEIGRLLPARVTNLHVHGVPYIGVRHDVCLRLCMREFLHTSDINIQNRHNGYFVPRFYIPQNPTGEYSIYYCQALCLRHWLPVSIFYWNTYRNIAERCVQTATEFGCVPWESFTFARQHTSLYAFARKIMDKRMTISNESYRQYLEAIKIGGPCG